MDKKKEIEEPTLKEVLIKKKKNNEKITELEEFLIRTTLVSGQWYYITESWKVEAYSDVSHIIAFSEERNPNLIDGYVKFEVHLEWFKNMIHYYEENNGEDSLLALYIKKGENPMLLHDGEIWGYLAPRLEGDVNK